MTFFKKTGLPTWWLMFVILLYTARFFPDYVMIRLSLSTTAWDNAMNAISVPPGFSGWIWIIFAVDIIVVLLQLFYIKNSNKKEGLE